MRTTGSLNGLRLLTAIVLLSLLLSAGPMLLGLIQAAVPLVIAAGSVVVVVRLVWFYTNRY